MSGKRDKPYRGKLSALDTLFGEAPAAAAELVPVDQIQVQPGQPRRYFGQEELQALAASIREHGVLQPLLARPLENGAFELVAGERRLRAAREVGLAEVPVVVRKMSASQAIELALLENLQREDLNPVEETDAMLGLLSERLKRPIPDVIELLRHLYDEGRGRNGNNIVSSEEQEVVENIFALLGRLSIGSFYTHRLPLLRLPEELLEAVRSGQLEYTKARELSKVKDILKRAALLERVLQTHMGFAEIRGHVATVNNTSASSEPQRNLIKRIQGRLAPRTFARLPSKTQKEAIKLLEKLDHLLDESGS